VTDPQTIHADEFLAHPPVRVWRALTDPELLARWLMPNDFKLEVGHRFTFQTTPMPWAKFDGTVKCEVLDFETERMLLISWVGGTLDTTVTWRLVPEGHGTRVFVEHTGFDLDDPIHALAFKNMGSGWRSDVIPGIGRVLDQMPDQTPERV
jgi:uncharacterized protein YndB with AHSA1/START domain